jgi:DEAD/DEAH box helicase
LHWECKNRVWKDGGFRAAYTSEVVLGSVWNFCLGADAHAVRRCFPFTSLVESHPIRSELAFQISDQFTVLGGSLNLRTAIVVGGMDMMAQATELGNRPHVVVATPGRIVDHLRSSNGEWDLSRIKFLVRSPTAVNDAFIYYAWLP